MKTKFTLIIALLIGGLALRAQQLPNASFEVWSDSLTPDGWETLDNMFFNAFGPPVLHLSARDTVDVLFGSSSILLRSDTIVGQPALGVQPGIVSTGGGTAASGAPVFQGIAFTHRPDTLWFFYQYTTLGHDTATFSLTLWNDTSLVLGVGAYLDTTSSWSLGYLPLATFYNNSSSPDSLLLQFFSSNMVPAIGSVLHLDSVFFTYSPVTAIHEISPNQVAVNIFPNPATDQVTVTCGEDLSGYNLTVYDVSGKMVINTVLDNSVNNINTSKLSNGTYIYRISDKTQQVINEGKFSVQK